MGQREFPQIYPQPGYVEHDAVQILQTTLYAMRQAVEQAGIRARDIAAISITNQRETTVAWDAVTGIPVCNAIVWQCRRTAPECERLRAAGMERYIKGHHWASHRPLLLRHQDEVDSGERPYTYIYCEEGAAALWHHRHLAGVLPHRRGGLCHRRDQRLPHHAV